MDKLKRIACIIGVVLILSMYLITLISAIFYKKGLENLFMASAWCTFVVPVFIYAMLLIARVLSPKHNNQDQE
jgi:putative hydrolase of the HAD superfamily